ncbi:MAG: hypothetical protein CMJ36_00145 [Phycisphaerae bacterium]|nr:hypothetical protein [Phycisphaerae bacterium]
MILPAAGVYAGAVMPLPHFHIKQAERAASDSQSTPHHAIRKIIGRCAIAAVILVGLYLLIHFMEPWMPDIRTWVKSLGAWGPLAYCLLFIVLTALFFPESVVAIAAGTLFGFWMGILWVVVAGTLGALLIFAITRTLFREPVRQRLRKHPKLLAFDEAAGREGFKLMFLLRLAPVNYSLLCYLLSVSSARLKPYTLACIGMFPGNISTVYFGFAARHVSEVASHNTSTDWVKEASIYSGLAFTVIASTFVARMAMRTVRKMQDQHPADPINSSGNTG